MNAATIINNSEATTQIQRTLHGALRQGQSAPSTGSDQYVKSDDDSVIVAMREELETLKQMKSQLLAKKASPPVDEMAAMKEEVAMLRRQLEMKKMREELDTLKKELGLKPAVEEAPAPSGLEPILGLAAQKVLGRMKEQGKIDENGKPTGTLSLTDEVAVGLMKLLNDSAAAGSVGNAAAAGESGATAPADASAAAAALMETPAIKKLLESPAFKELLESATAAAKN